MRRHDLDVLSLFAGAVFAVVALTALVRAANGEGMDLGWLFPVVLVGIGIAGLASALRTGRGGDERQGVEEA